MANLKTIDQTNNYSNQTVVTTTETIIATSPLVTIEKDNGFVWIVGYCDVKLGSGLTAVTFQFRKGTTVSGTVIGSPQALAASASTQIAQGIQAIDTYALAGGVQYVLTITQGAGAGNATVNEASIVVLTF